MMNHIYKDASFIESLACLNAFQQLKKTFITAPILMKFELDKQIVVECNAFNYVTKDVFSQFNSINTLGLVAYFSKRYFFAKCNYDIYDKKLVAII